jgi:hypothetical protein
VNNPGTDLSYAAAGYTPLTARLIQGIYTPRGTGNSGMRVGMMDVLKALPGPLVELHQMDLSTGSKVVYCWAVLL